MTARRTDADVVIIGNGPTGQTLSLLLARHGWRVIVLERWPDPYPFPRIKGFDGETARNFAAAGIGPVLPEIYERLGEYEFHNGAGQTLIHIDVPFETGRDGWPPGVVIHHPTLEAALSAQAQTMPTLEVRQGNAAERVADHGDHVEVFAPGLAAGAGSITCRWLVGCDGANSFVREHIGAKAIDLGFEQDWLLCDVVFHEPRRFDPNDRQICDPLRPTTMVASGKGHRRWEFRRLPGETLEELNHPDTVWRLLKRFDATPENATLCRYTTYTFRAQIADAWRAGRLLIAGDAAHLMPPFAGQGMCSGIRDAANLAWKLDLVLRAAASEALLDSYQAERAPQVRQAIDVSVEFGRIITELDTVAAAARDAHLISRQAQPDTASGSAGSYSFPMAHGVLRHDDRGEVVAPAGLLMPQGRVRRGSGSGMFDDGMFDDVVGRGFVLITTVDPADALDEDDAAFLAEIGTHVVRVRHVETAPEDLGQRDVVDLDNVYLPFLGQAGQVAVLVRPDFYVFGGAHDRADLATLVAQLRTRLREYRPDPGAG